MSGSAAASRDELGYAIVRFLDVAGNAEDEGTRAKIKELTKSTGSIFGINMDSKEDFLQLDYLHSLEYILKSGVEAKNAGHFPSDLLKAQTHPKYATFMKFFPTMEYFAGATEGSLEHLRRESRVLTKFRENYAEESPENSAERSLRDILAHIHDRWPW